MLFQFGLVGGRNAKVVEPASMELARLFELLQRYEVAPKDGDALIPAIFRPCPVGECRARTTRKDCGGGKLHRLAENVVAMTGLGIDIDKIVDRAPFDATLAQLRERNIAFVWWETYSHDPGVRTCARILIPFAQPLEIASAEVWRDLIWHRLMNALPIACFYDRACSDASRLYYSPRKPSEESVRHAGSHLGELFDPVPAATRSNAPAPALRVTPSMAQVDTTRPVDIEKIRRQLAAVERPDLVPIAKALLKGVALTPAPSNRPSGGMSRWEAWRTACALMSNIVEGWESPEVVYETFFHPSYNAEVAESPDDFTDWDTVESLYESALESAPAHKADRAAKEEASKALVRSLLHKPTVPSAPGASGAPPAPPADDEDASNKWETQLALKKIKGKDGEEDWVLASTPRNIELMLYHSDEWKGVLRMNQLSHQVEMWGGPLLSPGQVRSIRDSDDAAIVDWFEGHEGMPYGTSMLVKDSVVHARVLLVADRNAYDPLQDYLNSLTWDGIPRDDTFLETYLKARTAAGAPFGGPRGSGDLTSYVRTVSAKFMIQCVARAFDPGCEMQTVMTLEGKQGIGKTRSLKSLAGQFYSSPTIDPKDKDSKMSMSSAWIIELGELRPFRHADEESLKKFISDSHDYFRPPYGRSMQKIARHCVCVGTTNDDDYLTDPTGNRRHWVIACEGKIDVAGVARDRDQLWAEAVVRYRRGEPWHMTDAEAKVAEEQASERMTDDIFVEKIQRWFLAKEPEDRPKTITNTEVVEDVFQEPVARGIQNQIGRAAKRMGWVKTCTGKLRQRTFVVNEELLTAPKQTKGRSRILLEAAAKGLTVVDGGKPPPTPTVQ